MVRKGKTALLFAVLCVILTAGQWYNGSYTLTRTKSDYLVNADWVSNDLLLTDLLYEQHYQSDTLFTHSMPVPSEVNVGEAYYFRDAIMNGEAFPQEAFEEYTSNIVAQRFLYRLLDKMLPLSPIHRLRMMELMTSVLTAVAAAVILLWLGKIVSPWAAVVSAAVLSFACPYFTVFGKNLYWAPWIFWLPAAVMVLLTGSRRFLACRHGVQAAVLFGAAFLTCLWKQMCCFEFTSTAMIAMAVPAIYWLLLCEKTRRQKAELFLLLPGGGIASFAAAFCTKYGMLVHDRGAEQARTLIENNLRMRVGAGDVANSHPLIRESAETTVSQVVRIMLQKPLVSVMTSGGIIEITSRGFVLILLVLTVPAVWSRYKRLSADRKYSALLCCAWISLLAPLSWFVLAKPHAYIHNDQCTSLWYCPFVPIVMAVLWAAVQNHMSGPKQHLPTG